MALELDIGSPRGAPPARTSGPGGGQPLAQFDLDDSLQLGPTSNSGGAASAPTHARGESARPSPSHGGPNGLDLDLGVEAPPASGAQGTSPRASSRLSSRGAPAAVSWGGEGLDGDAVDSLEVDLAEGAGPKGNLDLGPSAAPSSARSGGAPLGGSGAPSACGSVPGQAGGPASAADPAARLLAGPGPIDPAEVEALAGYGPAPSALLASCGYAWRVLRRRPQLRRLHQAQQLAHEALAAECRERFVTILDELRPQWGEDDALSRDYVALDKIGELVAERTQALEQSQAQHGAQLQTIEQGLGALRSEQAQVDARLQEARAVLGEREALVARTEAQVKRADIELRALHEAARAAAGKGARFAPPEHARRIASVEQRKAELEQRAVAAQQSVQEAQPAARQAEAELRAVAQRLVALGTERKQFDRQAGQLHDLRGQAVSAAVAQRQELAERIVRGMLAQRHPALESGARELARSLDERLGRAAAELERHRLAVDAFERATVRRGALLAIGAALALVALLILAVIATRPEPPPKPPPSEFDRILEGRGGERPNP